MDTNSSSWVMPVMISGITSGAFTMPVSSNLPRNSGNRTSEIAAKVPRITAPVETATPMRSDSHAASRTCWLCTSCVYQLVEKPPHTLTSADALNEYPINTNIGMYRIAMPMASTVIRNGEMRSCMS